VPDARPKNKSSTINAPEEVHHRETCGFLSCFPMVHMLARQRTDRRVNCSLVRMSTNNTRVHYLNLHLHRGQDSPYLVSPRAAANSDETRREKTRLASSATRRRRYTLSVRPRHQHARKEVVAQPSTHLNKSIGTTCKKWLEWAVPVACRASQAFGLHYCWANKLWATETLPNPLCSSCALRHCNIMAFSCCRL
jgi:hypothetical protein